MLWSQVTSHISHESTDITTDPDYASSENIEENLYIVGTSVVISKQTECQIIRAAGIEIPTTASFTN